MKPVYLIAVIATAMLLPACGPTTETTTTGQSTATNDTAAMRDMAMPADAKMARSTGTVTAIDTAAGKITLAHAAIPEVNWPPMTMTFGTKLEILNGVAVGDKIAFDVTIKDNVGEVTAVHKQ
ncbi:MAG: copper-binding protein [Candidatus Sphingomonas phytovorans]|nr:copper-binding protein [Sphingomonas sp.]WEK02170.1 MAG: copper-binding protein [Sphingomonas sp.]